MSLSRRDALKRLVEQAVDYFVSTELVTRQQVSDVFTEHDINEDKIAWALKEYALPPAKEGKLREYIESEGHNMMIMAQAMPDAEEGSSHQILQQKCREGLQKNKEWVDFVHEKMMLALRLMGWIEQQAD